MRAVVNYERAPFKVEMREKPTPEIGDDDVLLAMQGVGVCGSDLHQWHASHSWAVNYPVTLGHEFAGVIAQTGRNVKAYKEGDRVVSETAASISASASTAAAAPTTFAPIDWGSATGWTGQWRTTCACPYAVCTAFRITCPSRTRR